MLKIFFKLDFNNPAVNTFFTPTKIFSHSRFINGWYIGRIILWFYFINLALPPFGQTKKIFTRKLYSSRNTPIVWHEKTFLISCFNFKYITLVCSPFEHSGIFLCKNFINFKSSAFELFKKKSQQKITQHKLSYLLCKLLNFYIFAYLSLYIFSL